MKNRGFISFLAISFIVLCLGFATGMVWYYLPSRGPSIDVMSKNEETMLIEDLKIQAGNLSAPEVLSYINNLEIPDTLYIDYGFKNNLTANTPSQYTIDSLKFYYTHNSANSNIKQRMTMYNTDGGVQTDIVASGILIDEYHVDFSSATMCVMGFCTDTLDSFNNDKTNTEDSYILKKKLEDYEYIGSREILGLTANCFLANDETDEVIMIRKMCMHPQYAIAMSMETKTTSKKDGIASISSLVVRDYKVNDFIAEKVFEL